MHANKCVVTSNKAVYFSIVVSLKETFTFDANRDITRPNLSIRSNRGNRNNFAIRITMDPDLCRSFEYMKISPNVAPLFDELFDHAFDLTYNTLGGFADHDTSPFRHSVWYYTLRLYGIHYDDYNYGEINKICPRPMKEFIKMVACYPQVIKREHFVSIAREMSFKDSEMVHICLLVMEARAQATLLYGLRCILSVMRPKE